MISGARSRGYTIIEVLIFLAVSGALMASALALIGGQQRRTQFTQAVREFESRITDIINDVSTGYYPNTGALQCAYDLDAGGVSLTSGGAREQGSNSDCTFIGRVIQFNVLGEGESSMRIYTVAGQRQTVDGSIRREPINLFEAKPRLIAAQSTADPTPDAFEGVANNPAVAIGKVLCKTCNTTNDEPGGIGIFSTFGSYSGNSLQSGTITAQVVPIISPRHPTMLRQPPRDFVADTNANLSGPDAWPSALYDSYVRDVQASGITICLLSQDTEQHARLKIGGNASQLTTSLSIHNGNRTSDCGP